MRVDGCRAAVVVVADDCSSGLFVDEAPVDSGGLGLGAGL